MRVTLPDGEWADLREAATLSNRLRTQAQRVYPGPEGDFDAWNAFGRALCAVFVTAWSVPRPIPGEDAGSLDEIPGRWYDALVRAIVPVYRASFLGADPTPEARADPDSPFDSSPGSGSPRPTLTPASGDGSPTSSAPIAS